MGLEFPNNLPKFPPYQAYYRRNNFGQPCVWYADVDSINTIRIYHGIVGKKLTEEVVNTNRSPKDEVKSRTNAKRKAGYKQISELKDNTSLPVEGEIFNYLNTYLPFDRSTSEGNLLPMLAKTYNNENNKLFKKVDYYIGQWKINGLRCFISAERVHDFFNPIRLRFQSREGTVWTSLNYLEEYLLKAINPRILNRMLEEHYILDGELYIPGKTVNEINHAVKDYACAENKLLQYWCYDIAIEDSVQQARIDFLMSNQPSAVLNTISKSIHLNNTNRFVILPSYTIFNDEKAVEYRNIFINFGFEGLIMRNVDSEYQFGKRNNSMIKFKASTDGKFKIVDIYSEGVKRPDIPLFLLKNDVNDETFEVHVGGSQDYQKECLRNKDNIIGKYMYVEFGERSGITAVPFHVKTTRIM